MKTSRRMERVGSLIRETLAEIFLLSVRDPRVRDVVITRVQVTTDLSLCRVYVRTLAQGEEKEKVMEGLRACSGFIRREIGSRIRLLRVPRFEFFHDDLPEKVAAVEALIEKVKESGRY